MEKINELKRTFSQRLKKLTTNKGEENQDVAPEDCAESRCVNWSIENLDVCPLGIGKFLESPPFYSGLSNGTKWIMRLYPSGRNEENSGKVGLFICRVSSEEKCQFKCQFTLQNSCLRGGFFHCESTLEDLEEHGTDEFFFTEDLSALGVMKIECNMLIKYADRAEKFNLSNKGIPHCSCSLSKDLESMCLNEKHSDVTLQIADVKFPVHRGILAARSKKFSDIFKSSSKEGVSPEEIQVDDIEESVIRNLLTFIYTGKIHDTITVYNAISLYTVAVKYSLEELRKLCLNIVLSSISTDNFCRIAGLADIHHSLELKSAAKSFFRNYSSQILESNEWKTFLSEKRSMALELMEVLTSEYKTT